MSAVSSRWLIGALLASAAGLLTLLLRISESTQAWSSSAWLLLVWASASGVVALASGHATRALRGVALWVCCLPLATLAHGAAAPACWALTVALFSLGLSSFLRVPIVPAVDNPVPLPDITLTDLDVLRITRLFSALPASERAAAAARALEGELARARVVPSVQVPADVVTMNTRLIFEDLDSGQSQEAVLVYPDHEDPAHGRLSVMGPVGSALIGLRVGQSIDWRLSPSDRKRYRIRDVLYQPEAAGHFHL